MSTFDTSIAGGRGAGASRPPNELDTPGDAPGIGAPVGIVGSLPRQVEDRQAG